MKSTIASAVVSQFRYAYKTWWPLPPAKRNLAIGWLLLIMIAPGCGGGGLPAPKTGRVSGTIQLGSAPLRNATITFEDPVRGIGASAVVEEGAYNFDTPLIVGNYLVTAQSSPPPPSAIASSQGASSAPSIPKQYQTSTDSGLKATVVEGENKFDFQLK